MDGKDESPFALERDASQGLCLLVMENFWPLNERSDEKGLRENSVSRSIRNSNPADTLFFKNIFQGIFAWTKIRICIHVN